LPREHRTTPFELTAREWASTQELLLQVKEVVLADHAPDGWNVGWNVGSIGGQTVEHVHCHLIPRYRDELHARKGIRWLFKQPENAVDVGAR
jgi:diadenosine tetraphosphate (Ap4A) HIT family hydrolase